MDAPGPFRDAFREIQHQNNNGIRAGRKKLLRECVLEIRNAREQSAGIVNDSLAAGLTGDGLFKGAADRLSLGE